MSDAESNDAESKEPVPQRVVDATLHRKGVSLGPIAIMGSTKHGPTAILSFAQTEKISAGDTVKTKAWIFNAREFSVIGKHKKEMKLPGVWFEVRPVAGAAAPAAKKKPQRK
jgi:hypothetical protein